jgi:integrase
MNTRRRGRGEGNIYQRADGRWAARLSAGYERGRRARVWVYGLTRAECASKLATAIRAHQDGILAAPSRLTTGEYLTRWLDDCARPKLRPRTLVSYAQVVRLHITPHLGRVPLQKLTPQQVQAWLNKLQKDGLSSRSCQYARAILRSAFGQALRWGLVSRNVVTLVAAPRVERHEIQPLTPEQARTLLKAAKGHPLEALVTVALALGLRQGEALGLRWDAIDFERGTLNVRVALQRVGGEWLLVEPKSARSRRTIALPNVVVGALQAHRVRQLQDRLVAGRHWQDHGFVFTSSVGTPLEPSNATKRFRKLLVSAGVPSIRFHDLRHTAATFLLAQGVDPRTIMETLGHSQISLTLNTYSHVLPVLQREAARKMDGMLRG